MRTTFPKLKSSINLKNGIQQLTTTDEIELTLYYMNDMIGQTTDNQQFETIMEEHVTIE